MVKESGILYTIEGVAAGVLMITTAYLVISTTMVFTPGDTHIIDMQLEQLGNDVLAALDTPPAYGEKSVLEKYISEDNEAAFRNNFSQYSNAAAITGYGTIKFQSEVFYRSGNTILSYNFADSGDVFTGREHMVKVRRLVFIEDASTLSGLGPDNRPQSVLLEVTLWRD